MLVFLCGCLCFAFVVLLLLLCSFFRAVISACVFRGALSPGVIAVRLTFLCPCYVDRILHVDHFSKEPKKIRQKGGHGRGPGIVLSGSRRRSSMMPNRGTDGVARSSVYQLLLPASFLFAKVRCHRRGQKRWVVTSKLHESGGRGRLSSSWV